MKLTTKNGEKNMIKKEKWMDIVGYQGIYQVSNLGRVISLGNDKNKKEKILKHKIVIHHHKNDTYKAHVVGLHQDGKRKYFMISRLVYSAFNGEIPNGYEVDHLNNNPQDNRLDNLQLLSHSDNLKKRFIDNPNLNVGKAKRKILCLNNNVIYQSITDASRSLNVIRQNIHSVLTGRYTHTGGYTFQYV